MSATRRPEWRLFFDCPNDGGEIGDLDRFVERAKAGLVREQFRECDLGLPVLRELRPELRDATR
ncbi:MAG TPA: hypothetical protein VGG02_06285 [Chthoniobacterales bacterium]